MIEDKIAEFLLEHPPLDEIGGPITDIVETYRANACTKEHALEQMKIKFGDVLQKYIEGQKLIARSMERK